MDLDYILYDTIPLGTVINTEFQLFKVAQGGDATHTENFTNMRGAGSLPIGEAFVVNRIGLIIDANTVVADLHNLFLKSFVEIRVNDKSLLKMPAALASDANMYGGHYTQTAAANEYTVGLEGDGFDLAIPIKIPGGNSFFVRYFQGTVMTATVNMKVYLRGTYTLPE